MVAKCAKARGFESEDSILKELSNPLDDLAAIRSAKGERVAGTCEWILTQGRYTSLIVEDSPQLLWLSGGPGIGKTMTSSFLLNGAE